VLNVVAIGLLIAFPAIGLATRRWESVLLPLGGWPIFYAGLNRNWWLDGTGDGWQAVAVTLTCVGVVSTIIGVAAGRAVSRT
jgi:hypothetical protein